jgi:hypothetical protein
MWPRVLGTADFIRFPFLRRSTMGKSKDKGKRETKKPKKSKKEAPPPPPIKQGQ